MTTDNAEGGNPSPPETLDEVDCPRCDTPPARFRDRLVSAGGDWWHVMCFLRSHPQLVEAAPKRCPNCGTISRYWPLTRESRARSCPRCLDVFPADAERDETVTIQEPAPP